MAGHSRTDVEPVAEIKFGQVGIANLKLKRLDACALAADLAEKVASAENLFRHAPVVLDLSHLAVLPSLDDVRELLACISAAGMFPVGLSYGTRENEHLARTLGLPLFAKFRAAYEPAAGARSEPSAPSTPEPATRPTPAAPVPVPAPSGQIHEKPVRSGQQLYAQGRDLVVTALVGHGAEVIADGCIHVYGALRGRALAGARGDESARIFCQEFHAELVSIAGQYRVFEEIPADLRGQPVQVWLEDDRLVLKRLGAAA